MKNFGHCLMDFFEETGPQVTLSEVGIFGKTQALKKDYSHAILPQALQELALGLLILGGSIAITACFTGIPAIIAASACVLTCLYIIDRIYQAITDEPQRSPQID